MKHSKHILTNKLTSILTIFYTQQNAQRVIKDERFYAGIEPEDDSLWLPAQLLRTTSSISAQGSSINEETLVNVLRLFLAMACSPTCTLNGRLLIEILSKCGKSIYLLILSNLCLESNFINILWHMQANAGRTVPVQFVRLPWLPPASPCEHFVHF